LSYLRKKKLIYGDFVKICIKYFKLIFQVIGAYYKVYTDLKNFKQHDVLEALDMFEEELVKRGTPFFAGT